MGRGGGGVTGWEEDFQKDLCEPGNERLVRGCGLLKKRAGLSKKKEKKKKKWADKLLLVSVHLDRGREISAVESRRGSS